MKTRYEITEISISKKGMEQKGQNEMKLENQKTDNLGNAFRQLYKCIQCIFLARKVLIINFNIPLKTNKVIGYSTTCTSTERLRGLSL